MAMVSAIRWGIKDSLLGYIRSLPDGEVALGEPANQDGSEFVFPIDADGSDFDPDSLTGELKARGSVTLSGHWGALRIVIGQPRLVLENGDGQLILAQLGLFSAEPYFTLATLRQAKAGEQWTFDVFLSAEGRQMLGEQYLVGHELSPLILQ